MKIQRPNIKINKTWLMLIAAVVLALLTTWLTSKYLAQREQTIEETVRARNQTRGATVTVVVPVRSMSAGTMLDQSTVASRSVPADFVYSDTITVADFEQYKNNVLIRGVERGKPLRKGDVQEVFADFSGSLKEGTRAMTINVDEINSVSHMVEPGNLVDLMLVLSSGDNGGNQTVVPFLDQVKVLATGQKVTHDDPADQNGQRKVSYSNFTLEVTPTQAARLALATELGKIRAVLRNEKDKQTVDFETVTANNLLEDIRERTRRSGRHSSGGYVEYFIGGKTSNEPVAPAINVPLAAPMLPAQADASAAGNGAAMGQMAAPQNLTDLVKLSLGNTAAPAKSNK
ncbi:MAG TPA: Flp pilus assembly protein CpaB [Oxalicibacterium sp.]|nr:Flp pilus assembly protein CpaB [Oxalicibacterium sp.]